MCRKGRWVRASLPGILASLKPFLPRSHCPQARGTIWHRAASQGDFQAVQTTLYYILISYSVFYFFLKFIEKESYHCGYLISSQVI